MSLFQPPNGISFPVFHHLLYYNAGNGIIQKFVEVYVRNMRW